MARKSRKRRKTVQPAKRRRSLSRRKLAAALTVLIAIAAVLLYLKPWAGKPSGEGTVTLVPHYWVIVPEDAALNASKILMKEYAEEIIKDMPSPAITELYKALRNINPWCRLAEIDGENVTSRYVAIYVDVGRVSLVTSYFKRNYNLSEVETYLSVHHKPSIGDLVDSILNVTENPGYWLIVRPGYAGHEQVIELLEERQIDYIYFPPREGNIYGEIAVSLTDAPVFIDLLQENNLTLASYPTPIPAGVVPT